MFQNGYFLSLRARSRSVLVLHQENVMEFLEVKPMAEREPPLDWAPKCLTLQEITRSRQQLESPGMYFYQFIALMSSVGVEQILAVTLNSLVPPDCMWQFTL